MVKLVDIRLVNIKEHAGDLFKSPGVSSSESVTSLQFFPVQSNKEAGEQLGQKVAADVSQDSSAPVVRRSITGLSGWSSSTPLRKIRRSNTNVSACSALEPRSIRAGDQARILLSNLEEGGVSQIDLVPGVEVEIPSLRERNTVPLSLGKSINELYELGEQLGEGGYGKVFACTDKNTGMELATKFVQTKGVKEATDYLQEIQILARMMSPYVVHLHAVFREEENIYLIMDLCRGGDLLDYLTNYWIDPSVPSRCQDIRLRHHVKGVMWQEVAPLLWQMLSAIAYLHHHGFAHRDVKLENYMIAKKLAKCPEIKLVDFGLAAKYKNGPFTQVAGTLIYMAPEVIGGKYGLKCDVWSVGICGWILSVHDHPWGGQAENVNDLAQNIYSNVRSDWPPCDKPPELRRIIGSLLEYEPRSRPSAKEILSTCSWLRKQAADVGSTQNCCDVQ